MDQAEIFKQIINFWNNDMPFNRLLGLKIKQFDTQQSEVRFIWDDKLIGNPIQKILHGGVTASALDLAGGAVEGTKSPSTSGRPAPDTSM